MKKIGEDDLNPFSNNRIAKKSSKKKGMFVGPEDFEDILKKSNKGGSDSSETNPFVRKDPIVPSKNKKYNSPDNDDYVPKKMDDFK